MHLTEEQIRFADAYDWFALPPHPAADGQGWRVALAVIVLGPFPQLEQAWSAFDKLMTTVPKAKIWVKSLNWEATKDDFERACQAAERGGLRLVGADANPISNYCEADFVR